MRVSERGFEIDRRHGDVVTPRGPDFKRRQKGIKAAA
jgi:hypothetical protein